MNNLITINTTDNDRPTVMGRELHTALEIKTQYSKWFERMCEYGFSENSDYVTLVKNVYRADGTEMPKQQTDHQLTIDMAKEICMIQRSEKGKQFRQYFIEVEKKWNSPEAVMARALQLANRQLDEIKAVNLQLEQQIEQDKPKTVFADAVSVSKTAILVGELAKLLKQNGIDIGQNRLFEWLRANGYLINRKGTDYNMPTQRSMELKLFEIKETLIVHSDGHTTTSKTPKVTGKGQIYFVNIFMKKKENVK